MSERVFESDLSAEGAPASGGGVGGGAAVAPARPDERITALDVLRGVSLLGILLLNINSFGLPFAAISDPTTFGGARGLNFAVWLVNHVLVEGKMRAIFSMLFGASVILMTTRAQRRGGGIEVADVYMRRNLWLAAFGVAHAYLIWKGDILFPLAVVGLVVFPFRRLSGRWLCVIGAGLLAVHTAQAVRGAYRLEQLSQRVAGYETRLRDGAHLTADEQAERASYADTRRDLKPEHRELQREIATARGGYLGSLHVRARLAAERQSRSLYRFLVWDVGGMLMLGMGLMKLGVLDGSRSYRFYAWMVALGYGIGLPLACLSAWTWVRHGFDLTAMFWYVRVPSDVLRFAVAAGHVGVVMIVCKAGLFPRASAALAGVGRMALTNYLLTSILCTLLFYGFGLGMFARLQRYELLAVVAAVWTINLTLSEAWLARWRFGPMEWAWRSLTYWRLQPMRLEPRVACEPEAPAEHAAVATAG